ncbi:hypothetical protein [Pseudomonas sp. LAIL14HWK12:I7]|uniref:hypothetical protein n=1 Tax=Pseudomonas sp. LAIL14HWK12:I7 TaxID=1259801 RepID=UPI000488AB36|nr:hypothetical protein [Pseudomonas sp. LAIL14HWK12:I7]
MTETVEWCTVVWQVVDGTSSTTSTGWTTFAVAALTGAFGLAGIWLGQKKQAQSQAKSVRAALLAEVAAIEKFLVAENYLEKLKKIAQDLSAVKSALQRGTRRFQVATADHLNRIYKANLAHLGALSKTEAILVVRLHHLLEGFLADVTGSGPLAFGSTRPEKFEAAAQQVEDILNIAHRLTGEEKR